MERACEPPCPADAAPCGGVLAPSAVEPSWSPPPNCSRPLCAQPLRSRSLHPARPGGRPEACGREQPASGPPARPPIPRPPAHLMGRPASRLAPTEQLRVGEPPPPVRFAALRSSVGSAIVVPAAVRRRSLTALTLRNLLPPARTPFEGGGGQRIHAEAPARARPHRGAGAKPTTPRAGQPTRRWQRPTTRSRPIRPWRRQRPATHPRPRSCREGAPPRRRWRKPAAPRAGHRRGDGSAPPPTLSSSIPPW